MKATRKLIPAFAMLLIAAVMMSTATFAWFSTNSDVYATGMTVTAKTNQTFLVIGTSSTLSDQYYSTTTIEAQNKTAELLPAKFKEVDSAFAVKWQHATGKNGTDGSVNDLGYSDVTTETGYYLKNTFYVRVANNAPSDSNLKLATVTPSGGNESFKNVVSVVVHVRDTDIVNTYRWENDNSEFTLTNPNLADTVLNNKEVILDVYVYIDGDNALVTTANVTEIANLTVDLHFEVD